MLRSVVTMLIGMGMTFCILLLIWVIVSVISRRMNIKKKNNNAADDDFDSIPYMPFDGQAPAAQAARRKGTDGGTSANAGKAGSGVEPSAAAAASGNDDGGHGGISPEIIAVITAAIEAFREEEGSGRLVVRKIRRLPADTQPWSIAARADCIESRKF